MNNNMYDFLGVKLSLFQKFIIKLNILKNKKYNKFIEYKGDGKVIIYPDDKCRILKIFNRGNMKSDLQLTYTMALMKANLTNKPITIHCGISKVNINDL